jgi:hypothetical protein
MVAREAVSALLSALAAACPRLFIAHLTRRLNTASPESPAHMIVLMAGFGDDGLGLTVWGLGFRV